MVKFKKYIAAALVAAAVGTAGMTAYAVTSSDDHPFWLDIKAYDDSEFSSYAEKTSSYSVKAHATAYTGASSPKPVYVSVADGTELEYYNTLTGDATLTENFKTEYMQYRRSGTPTKYDEFYLHGTSCYDVDLYGRWAP